MKKIIVTALTFISLSAFSQTAENIIIITTDGFRWQEMFAGMVENARDDAEDGKSSCSGFGR